VRANADFVLYWMTAFRRLHWNFALDRAIELAQELKRPLVVLEALRCAATTPGRATAFIDSCSTA
jgi:deoxyribodipyrimidine photo-lyase